MVFTFTLRAAARIAKGYLTRARHPVRTPIAPADTFATRARCALADVDAFWHMNNAMYFRHAELARWELSARSGLLQAALRDKWMFLAVAQEAQYHKPLPPLSAFDVVTSMVARDDKYIDFTHVFQSPDGSKKYCTAEVRAVVKKTTGTEAGKTVRPSEMQDLFVVDDDHGGGGGGGRGDAASTSTRTSSGGGAVPV
jgi:acyl-CoA thioesterase FadM